MIFSYQETCLHTELVRSTWSALQLQEPHLVGMLIIHFTTRQLLKKVQQGSNDITHNLYRSFPLGKGHMVKAITTFRWLKDSNLYQGVILWGRKRDYMKEDCKKLLFLLRGGKGATFFRVPNLGSSDTIHVHYAVKIWLHWRSKSNTWGV